MPKQSHARKELNTKYHKVKAKHNTAKTKQKQKPGDAKTSKSQAKAKQMQKLSNAKESQAQQNTKATANTQQKALSTKVLSVVVKVVFAAVKPGLVLVGQLKFIGVTTQFLVVGVTFSDVHEPILPFRSILAISASL